MDLPQSVRKLDLPLSRAGFLAELDSRGWTVKAVSERVLRLTSKNSSILFASADPGRYAETLERVRDADAYAMRHYRP
jgi:hypothetical protein